MRTGDAPTTSEWSTILLLTKVWLILEVWWQHSWFHISLPNERKQLRQVLWDWGQVPILINFPIMEWMRGHRNNVLKAAVFVAIILAPCKHARMGWYWHSACNIGPVLVQFPAHHDLPQLDQYWPNAISSAYFGLLTGLWFLKQTKKMAGYYDYLIVCWWCYDELIAISCAHTMWIYCLLLQLTFHWSLFLRIRLAIFQH